MLRKILTAAAVLAAFVMAADAAGPDTFPGCTYNSTPPSLTNLQNTGVQCDSAGNIKTVVGAGSAIIGKVGIDQTTPGTTNAVQTIAGTTGGATNYHAVSAQGTNATSVKAGAGLVYNIAGVNASSTALSIKLYDTGTTPNCNTDTVAFSAQIAANGQISFPSMMGAAFTNGIAYCITSGIADNNNVGVQTSDAILNLWYK